jgi:hypothetical protein
MLARLQKVRQQNLAGGMNLADQRKASCDTDDEHMEFTKCYMRRMKFTEKFFETLQSITVDVTVL